MDYCESLLSFGKSYSGEIKEAGNGLAWLILENIQNIEGNESEIGSFLCLMAGISFIFDRGSRSIISALKGEMSPFPFALLRPYNFDKCSMTDPSYLTIENLVLPYRICCRAINAHPKLEAYILHNFNDVKNDDQKMVWLIVKPKGKEFPGHHFEKGSRE